MLEFILILIIGIASGCIGPITGGGGLISVPALILLGLPPEYAIASSRAGALGLWLAAIYQFQKEGKVNWRLASHLALIGVFGGYIGSTLLIYFREFNLNSIVAVLLLLMFPTAILRDKLHSVREKPSRLRLGFGYFLFFCVMIFSGFFSGGDGTLGIMVLMLFFRVGIVEANATRGPAWLAMGIVAVSKYYYAGIILPKYALILFFGMAFGANIGAKFSIKQNEKWIRAALGAMIIIVAAKLFLDNSI